MSEEQITSALQTLIALVGEGKPMEAFEQFYHEDLEKTDLDGVLVKGKSASRDIGWQLLSKVSNVRDFTAVGQVIHGNRSFLVWSLDFDHADNGPVKVSQVAVQDWEDGLIIRERFFA
jgi:hypothetical protein